jgi:integrating conjugative element relaxase (TIGR03760 family)
MFKGLHQILNKVKPADNLRQPQGMPVNTAQALLAAEKHQKYLSDIKSLLNLPPKLYEKLYYQVIERFAEFVQNLPQTQHGAFSNVGGFLDHGIERAARALSLCLEYFYPQQKSFQTVTSQEALWIYAVFTAALFLDLGKLAVKYQITLCSKDGAVIKEWLPYSGTMLKQGTYYKYDFVKENRENLGKLVTSLLARQILDEVVSETGEDTGNGFNWLASDPDVLEAWLSLLNTEGRPMGTFMSVIPQADAQVIESYFGAQKAGAQTSKPFAGTMFDTPVTTTTPTGGDENGFTASVDGAETFLRWLRNGLESGAISMNDLASQVQVVREGVLMSSEVFQTFATANQQYRNPDSIEQQFMKLLESYVYPVGELQRRYTHLQGGIAVGVQTRWLLVTNPALLFPGQVPPTNPNLVSKGPVETAGMQVAQKPKVVANEQLVYRQ